MKKGCIAWFIRTSINYQPHEIIGARKFLKVKVMSIVLNASYIALPAALKGALLSPKSSQDPTISDLVSHAPNAKYKIHASPNISNIREC